MNYELKTERLVLRPLDIHDLDSVHAYASDLENTTHMMWLPNNSKEETKDFLNKVTTEWKKENPGFYEFAITLNGKQIGAISIYLNDNRQIGELGWIINKAYWKQGYALEAALVIKDWALKYLKVSKLIAHCDYRNHNSIALMQKIGLELEDDTGTRTYPQTGETAQELIYSLKTSANRL